MSDHKATVRAHIERQHARTWPVLEAVTSEDESRIVYHIDEQDWTVHTVLGHLADSERGILGQAQRLLEGQMTVPEGFDIDRWNRSAARRSAEIPRSELMAQIKSAYEETLAFLEGLDELSLQIEGRHSLGDTISIGAFITRIADHRAEHCDDIQKTIAS